MNEILSNTFRLGSSEIISTCHLGCCPICLATVDVQNTSLKLCTLCKYLGFLGSESLELASPCEVTKIDAHITNKHNTVKHAGVRIERERETMTSERKREPTASLWTPWNFELSNGQTRKIPNNPQFAKGLFQTCSSTWWAINQV